MYVKAKHQGHRIAYIWILKKNISRINDIVVLRSISYIALHNTVFILSATSHINCIVASLVISWHVSLSGHDEVALSVRLRK